MSPRLRADRRVGLLLGGVVFLLFVAIGATVALPASDPDVRSTKGAVQLGRAEARGLEVYRNEGCWYCHTQYVRNTPVDRPYGDALAPAAYAERSPNLVGAERVGPDLTHVGSRYTAEQLAKVLREPRSRLRGSAMPSYDYLSERDLEALVAYLVAMR